MIAIICFLLSAVLFLCLPIIKDKARDEYFAGLKRAGFLK